MSRRVALLLLASAPAVAHASGPGLGTLLILVVIPALFAGAAYGALCAAIRLPPKVALPMALAVLLTWLTFMKLGSGNYTVQQFVLELITSWVVMTVAAGVPFIPAYYAVYSWLQGRQAHAAQEDAQ